MFNRLLEVVIKAFLDWLALRIASEVKSAADKLADDKKAGAIDEKNVEEYGKAKTRAEQIEAAKRLLEGTESPSNPTVP